MTHSQRQSTQCRHSTERWQITGGGPNHSDACATTKTPLNLWSTNTARVLYKLYTVNIHLIFFLTAVRAISFPSLSHSVFLPRLFDFGFSSKTHKIKKKRFSWWETGTHIYRRKSTLCTDTACVCCPHTHSRTLIQIEDKTGRIQCSCKKKEAKGEIWLAGQLSTWMEMHGANREGDRSI